MLYRINKHMARQSRRIEFDPDIIEFLKDYRSTTGVSLQRFVEQLVVDKVRAMRLEAEFNDLKLKKDTDVIY